MKSKLDISDLKLIYVDTANDNELHQILAIKYFENEYLNSDDAFERSELTLRDEMSGYISDVAIEDLELSDDLVSKLWSVLDRYFEPREMTKEELADGRAEYQIDEYREREYQSKLQGGEK